MRNIKGETFMITGASSGFGALTARLLVKEHGAKVVLGARRVEKLEALVADLGKDNALAQSCDVKKHSDVLALAEAGVKKFGTIDGLVNNAGIMPLSMIVSRCVEDWDNMIDTNIKGVLYAIDAVLPTMLKAEKGVIVNISSIAGLRVQPPGTVYSGTKFAVRAISDGLRQELRGKIQVTSICPGAFQTELGNSIKDEGVRAALLKRFNPAEKSIGDATELAGAIVYALCQSAEVNLNELVLAPIGQG